MRQRRNVSLESIGDVILEFLRNFWYLLGFGLTIFWKGPEAYDKWMFWKELLQGSHRVNQESNRTENISKHLADQGENLNSSMRKDEKSIDIGREKNIIDYSFSDHLKGREASTVNNNDKLNENKRGVEDRLNLKSSECFRSDFQKYLTLEARFGFRIFQAKQRIPSFKESSEWLDEALEGAESSDDLDEIAEWHEIFKQNDVRSNLKRFLYRVPDFIGEPNESVRNDFSRICKFYANPDDISSQEIFYIGNLKLGVLLTPRTLGRDNVIQSVADLYKKDCDLIVFLGRGQLSKEMMDDVISVVGDKLPFTHSKSIYSEEIKDEFKTEEFPGDKLPEDFEEAHAYFLEIDN